MNFRMFPGFNTYKLKLELTSQIYVVDHHRAFFKVSIHEQEHFPQLRASVTVLAPSSLLGLRSVSGLT